MLRERQTEPGLVTFRISGQWRNILTGGPWTNHIKCPIPDFEFTEEFIIIKVLSKITIKHKTMTECEVKSNQTFIIKAKLSV